MAKFLDEDGVKKIWNKSKEYSDTKAGLSNNNTFSGNNIFNGVTTFTEHIKNDELDNTNGNAMVRYKSTENKVVLGGSTIPTTIMGSSDRPNYSADGSDFTGKPLALKSDVPTFSLSGTVLTITWNED